MKALYLIVFLLMSINGFSQARYNNYFFFTDSSKSPLSFISKEFYGRVNGLDSCCLFAVGSAKFHVKSDKTISQIVISKGIPDNICKPLIEAILISSKHWQIVNKKEELIVIIPLIIGPSRLCDRENYQDNLIESSANMFSYIDELKNVKIYNYFKKANRIERGTILSPLLIRGVISDVYER